MGKWGNSGILGVLTIELESNLKRCSPKIVVHWLPTAYIILPIIVLIMVLDGVHFIVFHQFSICIHPHSGKTLLTINICYFYLQISINLHRFRFLASVVMMTVNFANSAHSAHHPLISSIFLLVFPQRFPFTFPWPIMSPDGFG